MKLVRTFAPSTVLKRGGALLSCLALCPLACTGGSEPEQSIDSTGGATSSGGNSSSGGATNAGGTAGEGGDSGARMCGCAEGDYFIELTIEGETRRFTEPGAPSSIPDCDLLSSPSYYGAGTCLPDAVAACDEAGDCLTIGRTLTLVAADGQMLIEREIPRSTISVDRPRFEGWSVGATASGSFFVAEPDGQAQGGATNSAEINGTFSLCTVGGDLCAK